jgi:hypothetical protein
MRVLLGHHTFIRVFGAEVRVLHKRLSCVCTFRILVGSFTQVDSTSIFVFLDGKVSQGSLQVLVEQLSLYFQLCKDLTVRRTL